MTDPATKTTSDPIKHFVLDTNVLLHDPRALFSFEDNVVVVPIYVIEEIDSFKKDLSELGRNARQVSRYLDQLREEGSLNEGVKLDRGGLLRVAFTGRQLPNELRMERGMDSKILAVALDERDQHPGASVVFITKDTNLRIRADSLGLHSENYDTERTDLSELYSGVSEIVVPGPKVDAFYQDGGLSLADPYYAPNEFLVIRDEGNPSHTALGRFDMERQRAVPIKQGRDGVWGIRPRNKEQAFALELLLDDSVKLVTLVGKAGTGKTLLALAAGLQKATEEQVFQRLLVSRPIFPLGRDIGYLPGDVEEKLNPWMQPIFDNIEFLMNLSHKDKKSGRSYHELIDLGIVQIEPLTYIRGRSIPNQYMIVDEAQNLTPHEVKTIITRCGDNTKIVLTGDPYQIDHPYVDSTNNGLVSIVNKFRGEPIAGHVTLQKGERSALAELAANIL
ncbi:MAG: PhoH family protein [Deltaproteobacteria bacterium]|nr:PhoH family protein [Deltaproteobacteria bacterium]